MIERNSLAQRVGLLAISVPVLFFCLLGLVTNWPVDCETRGCGPDSLGGSQAYATIFGIALAVGLAAAVAIVVRRMTVGPVLLGVSAAMALVGIVF